MDKQFEFCRANEDDIVNIMNFIKVNWADNHILANHEEFFRFQHVYDDKVTYALAKDISNGDIKAVLGYIPYDNDEHNIMLALWQSIDKDNPFLGVELLQFLIDSNEDMVVSCVGINKKALGIYKYLGFITDRLQQYYRLADWASDDYRIAQVNNKEILDINDSNGYSLIDINSYDELLNKFDFDKYSDISNMPYKEPWYINKRYFQHPVYYYKVFGVKNDKSDVTSIIVAREQRAEGAAILRIVDYLGNTADIQYISHEIQSLIFDNNYEYIDFYQSGIDEDIMNKGGFIRNSADENIIPNYFEPFVRENIEVRFSTNGDSDICLFKADGDQDRPNNYIPKATQDK